MVRRSKLIESMRASPTNVSFSDLYGLCESLFGEPRQRGGSHSVFATPWPGDPRVNIQRAAGGQAKPYQVRQVLAAIDRLEKEQR
jgi:hypothetical protein